MKNVIIAIQARSNSTRLPGKIFLKLGGKEILQHVIDAAEESAIYTNQYSFKNNFKVHTMLLVPTGDEIVKRYKNKVLIYEGPEQDVLTRFYEMNKEACADYVVRLTADCPLLPSYVISKHINIAVNSGYDYISNVDEEVRTSVDGHDVEVISNRALIWLNNNITEDSEREHVTLALRKRSVPFYFRIGHVIGHLHQPHIKLSIDTQEDYERIKKEYEDVRKCIDIAVKKHGEKCVYRI
jgi:spore coat polysaccharide biosynthesis protein SpsF (cytidylyltransferase family)